MDKKNKFYNKAKKSDDQDVATAELNHEKLRKDTQGITKIRPFIDQYEWK